MRHEWPCSVLFSRLEVMLADGVFDADEQGELLRTLLDFVALRTAAQHPKASPCMSLPHVSLDAPYDEPCPTIDYEARRFVVTGEFACAKRPDVVSRIEQLGGDVSNSVSKKTNFLIVGSLGNELWKAQGYGTKLEKAVALRNDGAHIRIVGEKHWFESLPT
jgi:NAD-dependent DNA ligase